MDLTWDWIEALHRSRRSGEQVALVTLVKVQGSAPRAVGTRMLVRADGAFEGTIGGGYLEQQILALSVTALASGRSTSERFALCERAGQCCGGCVEVLIEVIGTAPRLHIFGAGHVGQAVSRVFEGTEFQVRIIDAREEWIRSERIPQAALRIEADPVAYLRGQIESERLTWSATQDYLVIMTHSHDLDRTLIAEAANVKAAYIGLIGSKTKWARFRDRLIMQGVSEDYLDEVRCPFGQDLGSTKAPQEIAISLAAELIRLRNENKLK